MVAPRFLVVDDMGDAAETVAKLLERSFGAQVDLASDARTALRHVVERGPYDLIISDIGLPGTDGVALLKMIRGLPDPRLREIPAVALTAYSESSMREAILGAGFAECAFKAITPDDLLAMCRRHVPGLAMFGQGT
jgi:CheY-like chemotaxis protein